MQVEPTRLYELGTCERELLLRVADELLVLRENHLAWVDHSGATALAAGENELLRVLWRGGLLQLPVGTDSDRVTLTPREQRVAHEPRVFGEPPVSPVSAGPSVMDTTTTAGRGRPSLAERVAAAFEAVEGDGFSVTMCDNTSVGVLPGVVVMSFGYLHGPAPECDITLDVRAHLRDPHIDPGFRELTGRDAVVRDRVLSTPGARELIDGVTATVTALLPGARRAGREVRVGIGCAGGRHRSVVLANEITEHLTQAGVTATVEHLHIDEPVVTR